MIPALTADLAVLLSTDDFGVTATYTGDAAPVEISGIFDSGDRETEQGSVNVVVSQLTFTCQSADLAAQPAGHTLAIDGTTYAIEFVHDDGTGVAVCYLRDTV